jgi:metal-responsive CopG/Arc/MetJ family transcriptional regulator
MKVKTSITLSEGILENVDRLSTARACSRSEVIESAVQAYLRGLAQAERESRDLEILNRAAERLNAEALEVLEFQVVP